MSLILGMHCVQDDSLARDPERRARVAALVSDPRWLHRFKLITVFRVSGETPAPRFKGVIPAAKLSANALEAVSSPSVESVMFGVSTKDSLDHAHFVLNTGRSSADIGGHSNARTRIPDHVDVDAAATGWVELQHEIVETIGALHGVIVTATNEYVLRSEIWLSLNSVDGRVMHPFPDEIRSYELRKAQLGHAYVRRPRWGTYLKPAHVAAIGGRARIIEVVQPEVTREVGDLFYVQLTARVSDAASEVAKQRYAAFCELVAPITVPRKAE